MRLPFLVQCTLYISTVFISTLSVYQPFLATDTASVCIARTRAHMYMYRHVHERVCTCTCMSTNACAHVRMCTNAYVRLHARVRTCSRTRTYMCTFTNAYVHVHTSTLSIYRLSLYIDYFSFRTGGPIYRECTVRKCMFALKNSRFHLRTYMIEHACAFLCAQKSKNCIQIFGGKI